MPSGMHVTSTVEVGMDGSVAWTESATGTGVAEPAGMSRAGETSRTSGSEEEHATLTGSSGGEFRGARARIASVTG